MLAAENATALIREPADVYHAKSKEYLSSHQLNDFRKCPLLYHRKKQGQIADEDRPAYLVGRAAHTLILEGLDRFEAEYVVGGPLNPKTGEPYGTGTKAWTEWAESQRRSVLTETQFETVARMNKAVRTHAVAMGLLADGEPEGVVRADYCGMPCQIRMDWFDPHQGIVDLKTCDDLTWFEADARRFGYVHQLAFYQAVLAQLGKQLLQIRHAGAGGGDLHAGPPDRRGEERAVPLRSVEGGSGCAGPGAAREPRSHRSAPSLSGRRALADRLRGTPPVRLHVIRDEQAGWRVTGLRPRTGATE